jgi:hypothetical protein
MFLLFKGYKTYNYFYKKKDEEGIPNIRACIFIDIVPPGAIILPTGGNGETLEYLSLEHDTQPSDIRLYKV